MDYYKLLDEILKFSIGSITISAVIIFVSKAFFKQWLAQRVEVHKAELNKDVEEYKSNLQRIYNEHSIRFSKLHSERAEVIKILYYQLVEMENNIKSLSYFLQREERELSELDVLIDPLTTSINKYNDYAQKNRIFFNDEICLATKEIEAIVQILLSFTQEILFKNQHDYDSEDKQCLEIIKVLSNEEIPKFKDQLEKEFKTILGVDQA